MTQENAKDVYFAFWAVIMENKRFYDCLFIKENEMM